MAKYSFVLMIILIGINLIFGKSSPDCKNGGIKEEDGTCTCFTGFEGRDCNVVKNLCKHDDAQNARKKCPESLCVPAFFSFYCSGCDKPFRKPPYCVRNTTDTTKVFQNTYLAFLPYVEGLHNFSLLFSVTELGEKFALEVDYGDGEFDFRSERDFYEGDLVDELSSLDIDAIKLGTPGYEAIPKGRRKILKLNHVYPNVFSSTITPFRVVAYNQPRAQLADFQHTVNFVRYAINEPDELIPVLTLPDCEDNQLIWSRNLRLEIRGGAQNSNRSVLPADLYYTFSLTLNANEADKQDYLPHWMAPSDWKFIREPFTLPLGMHTLGFSAWRGQKLLAMAKCSFHMVPLPLAIVLVGGEKRWVNPSLPLILDASPSRDLNERDLGLVEFTWTCRTPKPGNDNFCSDFEEKGMRVEVPKKKLQSGQKYDFLLRATRPGLPHPVTVMQKVRTDDKLNHNVVIVCERNCGRGGVVLSSEISAMHADCLGQDGSDACPPLQWEISPALDTMLSKLNSKRLVIAKGLQKATLYTVTLKVNKAKVSRMHLQTAKPLSLKCQWDTNGTNWRWASCNDTGGGFPTAKLFECRQVKDDQEIILAASYTGKFRLKGIWNVPFSFRVTDQSGQDSSEWALLDNIHSNFVMEPYLGLKKATTKLKKGRVMEANVLLLAELEWAGRFVHLNKSMLVEVGALLSEHINSTTFVTIWKQFALITDKIGQFGVIRKNGTYADDVGVVLGGLLTDLSGSLSSFTHERDPRSWMGTEDAFKAAKVLLKLGDPVLQDPSGEIAKDARNLPVDEDLLDVEYPAYTDLVIGFFEREIKFRVAAKGVIEMIKNLATALMWRMDPDLPASTIETEAAYFWSKVDTMKGFSESASLLGAEAPCDLRADDTMKVPRMNTEEHWGLTVSCLRGSPFWFEQVPGLLESNSEYSAQVLLQPYDDGPMGWPGHHEPLNKFGNKAPALLDNMRVVLPIKFPQDDYNRSGEVEALTDGSDWEDHVVVWSLHAFNGTGHVMASFSAPANGMEWEMLAVLLERSPKPKDLLHPPAIRFKLETGRTQSLGLLVTNHSNKFVYLAVGLSKTSLELRTLHYLFNILVKDARRKQLTVIKQAYTFTPRNLQCKRWNDNSYRWEAIDEGEEWEETERTSLTCRLNHLSLFSGRVLIAPTFVHPIEDAKLFLLIGSNWIVLAYVTLCLVVWLVWLFFARRLDRRDDRLPHMLSHAGRRLNISHDDWMLLLTPSCLGRLKSLDLWTDCAGIHPYWCSMFCEKVIVEDLITKEVWHFPGYCWLSLEHGTKLACTTLRPDIVNWRQRFQSLCKASVRGDHIWTSIVFRHPRTTFTRAQRLTVAFSLHFLNMVASIMFFNSLEADDEDPQNVTLYRLFGSGLIIAFEQSLITIPSSFIIVWIFQVEEVKAEYVEKGGIEGRGSVRTVARKSQRPGAHSQNEGKTKGQSQVNPFVNPKSTQVNPLDNTELHSITQGNTTSTQEGQITIETEGEVHHQRTSIAMGATKQRLHVPPSSYFESEDSSQSQTPTTLSRQTSDDRKLQKHPSSTSLGFRSEAWWRRNANKKNARPERSFQESKVDFKDIKDTKGAKYSKDVKNPKGATDTKNAKDPEGARDIKDATDIEETVAEAREGKESSPQLTSVGHVPTDAGEAPSFHPKPKIKLKTNEPGFPWRRPVWGGRRLGTSPSTFPKAGRAVWRIRQLQTWRIFVGWVLCISTIVVCAYFTVLYGLKYGHNASVAWLTSTLLSLIVEIFVTQPLKVLAFSFVYAFWFQRDAKMEQKEAPFSRAVRVPDIDTIKPSPADEPGKNPYTNKEMYCPLTRTQAEVLLVLRRHRQRLARRVCNMILWSMWMGLMYYSLADSSDPLDYYMLKHVSGMVLRGTHSRSREFGDFYDVITYREVYDYVNRTVVGSMLSRKASPEYLPEVLHPNVGFLKDNISRVVGAIRLRQQRVTTESSCTIAAPFDRPGLVCISDLDSSSADTQDHGENWSVLHDDDLIVSRPHALPAWTYHSAWELDPYPYPLFGEDGLIPGGGYLMVLGRVASNAELALLYLTNTTWLDRHTRVLFIEFVVFSPYSNIFCDAYITLERSPASFFHNSYKFNTFRLSWVAGFWEDAELAVFLVLFLVSCVITVREVIHFARARSEYSWSFFDVVLVLVVILTGCLYFTVNSILGDLLWRLGFYDHKEFISFQMASRLYFSVTLAMGVMIVLATVRCWRVLSFALHFRIVSIMLELAAGPLLAMLFLLVLVQLQFAVLFMLLAGGHLENIHTLWKSFVLLVAYLVDYTAEYEEFEDDSRDNALTLVAYWIFVAFMYFFFLNFFLSIVSLNFEKAVEVVRQKEIEGFSVTKLILDEFRFLLHIPGGRLRRDSSLFRLVRSDFVTLNHRIHGDTRFVSIVEMRALNAIYKLSSGSRLSEQELENAMAALVVNAVWPLQDMPTGGHEMLLSTGYSWDGEQTLDVARLHHVMDTLNSRLLAPETPHTVVDPEVFLRLSGLLREFVVRRSKTGSAALTLRARRGLGAEPYPYPTVRVAHLSVRRGRSVQVRMRLLRIPAADFLLSQAASRRRNRRSALAVLAISRTPNPPPPPPPSPPASSPRPHEKRPPWRP